MTFCRVTLIAGTLAMGALQPAGSQRRLQGNPYQAIITGQAAANGVPEALVHRVIMRESKYHPEVIGRGGAIGLMQIKLATARGVGYTGTADGLRDPATNLTYGIRYLAGAYRTANGNHDRAVAYYAGGYYYVAKRQRRHADSEASSANAWQLR